MMMLSLLLPFALAADNQHYTYDLAMNGSRVGSRTVDIQFLSRDDGERRVVEAYTELSVAGQAVKCRSTGSSGPRGATFSTSVDHNGAISQVQAVELPGGGFRVNYADAKGLREAVTADARLSTLDLLDPGRTSLLGAGGTFGLLMAETGTTVSGTVDAGKAVTVSVAGQALPATRYTLKSAQGSAIFDVDGSGLLLRSEIQWLGGTVTATVREAPVPRSWGEVDTIEALSSGVTETPL